MNLEKVKKDLENLEAIGYVLLVLIVILLTMSLGGGIYVLAMLHNLWGISLIILGVGSLHLINVYRALREVKNNLVKNLCFEKSD